MDILIQTEKVCKTYNRHRPDEVVALINATFKVHQGEVIVLKGPSGSGKSSLLSLVGCLGRPTSGSINVAGRDVAKLPERFLASIRRETFGFIFQQFNLLRDLSVFDNVLLPLYPTSLKLAEMRGRVDEAIERFGLGKRKQMKVRQLSGGEQQRVAIARALVNRPQIIIADEPTAHLDSDLSSYLLEVLAEQKRAGRTIIIATHDPVVYQAPLIDRTYEMLHGELSEVTRAS